MSFEAPNSPGILTETGLDPDIKLNLRTSHRDLGNGVAEVVLHVTVHALAGQRTVFLVELEQAGSFQISGFPPEATRANPAVQEAYLGALHKESAQAQGSHA